GERGRRETVVLDTEDQDRAVGGRVPRSLVPTVRRDRPRGTRDELLVGLGPAKGRHLPLPLLGRLLHERGIRGVGAVGAVDGVEGVEVVEGVGLLIGTGERSDGGAGGGRGPLFGMALGTGGIRGGLVERLQTLVGAVEQLRRRQGWC